MYKKFLITHKVEELLYYDDPILIQGLNYKDEFVLYLHVKRDMKKRLDHFISIVIDEITLIEFKMGHISLLELYVKAENLVYLTLQEAVTLDSPNYKKFFKYDDLMWKDLKRQNLLPLEGSYLTKRS